MADNKTLANVEKSLESLPHDMLKFSICMRSLYVEHNVSSKSDVALRFQKLRDATRKDAMIYLTCILPFSKKVVSAVDDYYGYYDWLDFENWSKFLPTILEETKSHRGLCQMTIKMHEDMLIALRPREDEARQIMLQFKELQEEYEQKVKDLGDSAAKKRGWAIGLAFIPFINIFASPILGALSKKDQAKAIAKSKDADLQEAATLIVEKELIPALKAYIKGLETVAGFFSIMENQLQQFIDLIGKSQDEPKKLHYTMMKRKAKEIRTNCQRFMFVIPAVTTNIASISTKSSDHNYIDKWLEKQKESIKDERNAKVKNNLLQMLIVIAKTLGILLITL